MASGRSRTHPAAAFLLLLLLGSFRPAAAADPDTATADDAGRSVASRPELPVVFHLQFGWLERVTGSEVPADKNSFLATGDLIALRRTSSPRTWGIGLHLAGDDDGTRWGVSAVLRRRLASGSHGYWQVAPGISFAGQDNNRTQRFPSCYLSAEIGDDRWFALCTGVEIVRYRDWMLGYREVTSPWGYAEWEPVYDAEGTEVSWHLGAKAQGWQGVLIFVGLVVAASVSLSGSGP